MAAHAAKIRGHMVASKGAMKYSRWCLPDQSTRVSSSSLVRRQ